MAGDFMPANRCFPPLRKDFKSNTNILHLFVECFLPEVPIVFSGVYLLSMGEVARDLDTILVSRLSESLPNRRYDYIAFA